MDTYNLEELQESFADVIDDVAGKNHQCKVTSPEGNIVLLSEETYHNILVTLELLSTPGLMNNVDMELIEEELSEASVS